MARSQTRDRAHGLWACSNCQYLTGGDPDETCAASGVTAIDAPCAWATGAIGSPGFDFDPLKYGERVDGIQESINEMLEDELCLVELLVAWRRQEVREQRIKQLEIGEHVTAMVGGHVRGGKVTKLENGMIHFKTGEGVPIGVYPSAILPSGTAQGTNPKTAA